MTPGLPLPPSEPMAASRGRVPDSAGTERLLALHLAAAVQRFGGAALGVVDLPPLTDGPLDPAQLRVGAALYWCMAVEQAGLLAAVEKLAADFRTGGVDLAQGATAERLLAFARAGH